MHGGMHTKYQGVGNWSQPLILASKEKGVFMTPSCCLCVPNFNLFFKQATDLQDNWYESYASGGQPNSVFPRVTSCCVTMIWTSKINNSHNTTIFIINTVRIFS